MSQSHLLLPCHRLSELLHCYWNLSSTNLHRPKYVSPKIIKQNASLSTVKDGTPWPYSYATTLEDSIPFPFLCRISILVPRFTTCLFLLLHHLLLPLLLFLAFRNLVQIKGSSLVFQSPYGFFFWSLSFIISSFYCELLQLLNCNNQYCYSVF